ncbi:hypothetical protein [Candidatus Vondammii sp. HM_W22]|uniref:hypothetical protein n=1 Tax=Candidatus Vondammii sp. HM_W22 TaxID=2687299 RepID=UPI002E7B80D8|nr:hypothetical protein [Candidatus Vondammii sp. HM_W22]
MQNAVEKDPAAEKLLLSHFTYVNYATDIPLTTGNSKIDADNVSPGDIGPGDRDNLDEGSFHDNRKVLYETYLLPGKIHYTFSGHSHRAGVYRLTGEPGYVTRKITTRGDYPDGYTHPDGTACLLVAGSGGPITRQNREGEYAGYGMEAPQGLKLDTESGKVNIVRDAQTRPRMAVLLDYLWYEGGHKALQYGLKGDGRRFQLRLDERWLKASEHGGEMLDEIRLHLHSGGKAGYQGYIRLKQTACEASQWTERVSLGSRSALVPVRGVDVEYEVAEGEGGMSWGDLDNEKKEIIINGGSPMCFLSIHLKQIEHGHLHKHYDYDSPWCFPASVSESEKGENRLVTIRRKGGGRSDVPDFEDIFDNPKLLGEIYDY